MDAIGTARLAARSIHLYLKKKEITAPPAMLKEPLPDIEVDKQRVVSIPRQSMPERPVAARMNNFEEVELGYDEETALKEAERCLNCGLYCYGERE